MRKQVLFLLVLVLTLSLLVGCSEAPQKETTENPETVVQAFEQPENTGLKMITQGETQHGYYDTIQWHFEMYDYQNTPHDFYTSNITYIDYATGIKTFLCSVPGCSHNNESCTSFITHTGLLTIATNSDETALFVINDGRMGQPVTDDDQLAKIYKMDLDGSNRTEIYEFKANESLSLDNIIADRENLYITTYIYQDATKGPTYELRKINIQTGEAEKLLELEQGQHIVSVFDDIICINDSRNSKQSFAFEDRLDILYEMPNGETSGTLTYGFSINDKTLKNLYDWTTHNGYIKDNHYFGYAITGEETGKLIVVDLKTGEKKEIADIPAKDTSPITLSNFFENTVQWNYMTSVIASVEDQVNPDTGDVKQLVMSEDTIHKSVINIETNEVVELEPYEKKQYSDQDIWIMAQTNDEYLVIVGKDDNATFTLINREGVSHTFNFPRLEYALIDKDDYYNNIENYRIIEDLI